MHVCRGCIEVDRRSSSIGIYFLILKLSLSLPLLILLRQGLSLDLNLEWQPTSPKDPPVFSSPMCWGFGQLWPHLAFYMVLGIWTQVLMLVHQILLPAEPSPSLLVLFFETGYVTKSRAHQLGWLATEVQGSVCLCLPNAGITDTRLFTWCWGSSVYWMRWTSRHYFAHRELIFLCLLFTSVAQLPGLNA